MDGAITGNILENTRTYDTIVSHMPPANAPDNDKYKLALLSVRELLVLKHCLTVGGPFDNSVALLESFHSIFFRELQDPTASQMILAFNKMVEGGRDRAKFDDEIKQCYT